MIVVIDNYDSFTYNLVQYLGELGEAVTVYRNDQASVREVAHSVQRIVVSPGPCSPDQAGISVSLLRELGRTSRCWGSAWGISALERPLVAG